MGEVGEGGGAVIEKLTLLKDKPPTSALPHSWGEDEGGGRGDHNSGGFSMDVIDALMKRYTTRAFKSDPLDRATIEKVLAAALRAPSWGNTQPWEIFVASGEPLNRLREAYMRNLRNSVPRSLDIAAPKEWTSGCKGRMDTLRTERTATLEQACPDKSKLKEMSEMNYQFFHAPVVLYLCMDKSLTQWSLFDLGLIAQSIMLAAQGFAVDSAVAVTFAAHPDLIRKELSVPDNLSVVIGIALGHADTEHPQNKYRSPRKSLQEAVRFSGM